MTSLHRVYRSASHFGRAGLSFASALVNDETGQDLIEYALVASLIGLASVSAVHALSLKIASAFGGVGNNLTSAY